MAAKSRGLWVAFVVAGLLALDVFSGIAYGLVIPAVALAVVGVWAYTVRSPVWRPGRRVVDGQDVVVILVTYAVVVGLFAIAFVGFTTDSTAGLFLSFAAGLIIGVAVPVVYTVWVRERPLGSLGLGMGQWPLTVSLGLLFAAVQFALTLWGYALPEPVDWVPLLVMSLAVGLFEAIFFRGFVQARLEASFGVGPGLLAAAMLYAVYHVGYGMGASEMVFLFGLGGVYAVAYRLANSIFVLWPLLTPLGAFYNNVDAGDIELPWASIAGFADVLMAMAVVVFLAYRHQRKLGERPASSVEELAPPDRLPVRV